jgi:hypothetical protein
MCNGAATDCCHVAAPSPHQVHDDYVVEAASQLLPYAMKLDIVKAATTLATALLGSTGGAAGSWGVVPLHPGETSKAPRMCVRLPEATSPLFLACAHRTYFYLEVQARVLGMQCCHRAPRSTFTPWVQITTVIVT